MVRFQLAAENGRRGPDAALKAKSAQPRFQPLRDVWKSLFFFINENRGFRS